MRRTTGRQIAGCVYRAVRCTRPGNVMAAEPEQRPVVQSCTTTPCNGTCSWSQPLTTSHPAAVCVGGDCPIAAARGQGTLALRISCGVGPPRDWLAGQLRHHRISSDCCGLLHLRLRNRDRVPIARNRTESCVCTCASPSCANIYYSIWLVLTLIEPWRFYRVL